MKYDFIKKHHLNFKNLEHDFLFSTNVVEVINMAEESNPERVLELAEKTNHYFSELKKYNLRDWLINPHQQTKINYVGVVLRLALIILTLPIYVIGLVGNYCPYKLAHVITTKKVRVKEFKASFYMGIGAVLFLVNYLLLFFIPKVIYSGWLGFLIVVVSFLCGFICLYLSPLRKKTMGIWRVLNMKSKNKKRFDDLVQQRKEIIKLYLDLN